MRAVIQKTVGAKVDVVSEAGTETCGKIDGGFVVLLGVTHSDTEKDHAISPTKSHICACLKTKRAS